MKRKYHTLILTMVLLLTFACSLTPATQPDSPVRPCHSLTCRFQARRDVVRTWRFELSPEVDGVKLYNGR